MKKDCSEQQQRALKKLVRCHKPTLPAMSAPMARKNTLPFPVGRRTTRSEAAKLRAERETHEKVSQLSKFDSNPKHSDDSSESTDSQSESKQNSTRTNDSQSETNAPQETVEEKTKKPRKKRISRALFRHDTIELIKPKKQELLQKTFSFKFKKLVDKSKEIYTKNDESPNDNEMDDKSKDSTVHEESDCTKEVKNLPENTVNISTNNNEEKTLHNKRLILDMPSLDSPSSPITNHTDEKLNRIEKLNILNKVETVNKVETGNLIDTINKVIQNKVETINRVEKLNKTEKANRMESNKITPQSIHVNIITKTDATQEPAKPTKSKDNLSVPPNVCHIQTNSTQNLAYPFYGIIPNRKPVPKPQTIDNHKHKTVPKHPIEDPKYKTVPKHQTIEDQIPKYEITIVPDHPKTKTSDSPQQNYLPAPRPPHQFKIKTHPVLKNPKQYPKYPDNPPNQPFPYPYLPPNNPYGYPYHLYPYLPPIHTQNNFATPEKPIWNPHIQDVNKQQSKVNMSTKEALKYKIQHSVQENGEKHEFRQRNDAQINCTVVTDRNATRNQLAQVAHNLERLHNHLNPLKVVKSNLEHLKINHENIPERRQVIPHQNYLPNIPPVTLPHRYSNPELLNTSQSQKRPAEEPKLIKRVRFDSNLPHRNDQPTPNNFASQTQKPESVIVSPNSKRSLETNEQRVIVPSEINLRTNFMQDTPVENKMQQTCSVIKKVCTNKNQHTIENILSNKCSKPEVNNNDYDQNNKIKILTVETITSKDTRYVSQNPQNPPQKSVIINAQSNKILHIDLTIEPDEKQSSNSSNALTTSQFSDTISLNDKTNRLTHTQSTNSDGKNTQLHVMSTEVNNKPVSERPMPKLIKIPDEYLHKLEETKHIEKSDHRVHKHAVETKVSEKCDNRVHKHAVETNASETIDNRVLKHAAETNASETIDNRMLKHAVETNATEISDNHAVETNATEICDNRVLKYAVETKASETTDNQVLKHAVETKASEICDNRVLKHAVETKNSEISDNRIQNSSLEAKPTETIDNRLQIYAVETKDSDTHVTEANKSDKYAYNDVPLPISAHVNNNNNVNDGATELPLNLSLKTAQNEQRQSIIVNNTKIHEPLDLSTLTLVKSDEEYNGYLKLLQEKNATGPYLFYKFVTGVRRRNNQPIFDLVSFFSLLKQGKLLEYKNMYNQCNK